MEDTQSLITEQRNERSMHLDRKSTRDILTVINEEDQRVPLTIKRHIPSITLVVDRVVQAFQGGGRLFYAGAGTSGRIGVLDASECPPTYGTDPEMVQAMIAGGTEAIFEAVEGAEDDESLGVRDIRSRSVTSKDVVIGITASGRAPYVIGALKEAGRQGAHTVSFTCNRQAVLNAYASQHLNIEVGPEVVTGSTRMKAGTTQKLVLNMITTTAMVRLGKVYDDLMIDVQPLNSKLVQRCRKIIQYVTDCSEQEARLAFERADGQTKVAILMVRCQVEKEVAHRILQEANGFVREAIRNFEEAKNR